MVSFQCSQLLTNDLMASIDKTSVREQIDQMKKDFERVSTSDALPNESRLLMRSMLTLLEIIVAIFLEKNTKKNSKNSSLPSTRNEKDDTALGQRGSKKKARMESAETADNSRTVETTFTSHVNFCDVCGADLSKTPCHSHERRTRIDIVFEKVVEHVDAEVKECPECDAQVKGVFPKDLHGPLQYGYGLKAYVVNLIICQMVALNRVQSMVKTLIGEVISEASLIKFVLRLHDALKDWEEASIDALLKSKALNVDETSMRVDKKNHWVHVYSSDDITLKFIHRKRGKEAINDIGIIPRYGGVIIHDCWSAYLSYDHCDHGLCGGHLLRELTFIIDSNGYVCAQNMKKLLKETCKIVSKRKSKKLTASEYTNLQKRYRNILTRGEKEMPEAPTKSNGKRGRVAKSEAHNLWERLRKHEAAVLLFAKDANVSFTNNRAERDLRMSKVKQKVSGCFRSLEMAQAYCRISSYVQTMANKGINPLIALKMAFVGEIGGE